jgi:thiol-disulfide isomerase/thioredoxin
MLLQAKIVFTKATKLLFALLFANLYNANAQVNITIKLPEINHESYYLARYYGDKFQMVDTAFLKSDSIVHFTQTELYPEGIYLLVDQSKNRLLEFLIADDQTFRLEIPKDQNKQLSCSGSLNTCLFIEQMNYTNMIFSQIKLLEDNQDDQVKKDSLLNLLATYQENIKTDHSDSFVAKIISAMEETKVPDSIAKDQRKAYYFYKSNFWNSFDLTDDRFLRSPLLNTKIKQYFEQLVPQQADSIIKEVDFLIGQTRENTTMRDYLIWYFTDQYQNPKIMGLDKVFVHLADTYFAHLEIANTTPSVKQKIMERADQLRRLTLGSPAPDLWLVDTTDAFVSFKSIEMPYIVLFFWDQDCGVCKKELKTLQELYGAQNRNFEIYGIAANADFDAWEAYLQSNDLPWINVNGMKSMTPDFHDLYDIYGTPVIYVLDPERKIIAKRIKAEQIPLVIEHDQKFRVMNEER